MCDEARFSLLSHKCSCESHQLGQRLASALKPYDIELLIDPFSPGDDIVRSMETFEFDSFIFLLSPASWSSTQCRVELETARRRGVPFFVIHLEGDVPAELRERIYWKPPEDDEEFAAQVHQLAIAICARVSFHRRVRKLSAENSPDTTQKAAQEIYDEEDRTLIAEYSRELAKRYELVRDSTTRYWMALALGKAGTPEAAALLRILPSEDHPLPIEGIRQALEMIADG